jgi:hypothetical protein
MIGILENLNNMDSFNSSEIVWSWDKSSQSWSGWSSNKTTLTAIVDNGLDTLTSLTMGNAVWVKNNKLSSFSENIDSSNSYNLSSGWNFISIYKNTLPSTFLSEQKGSIIWKWNNKTQKWQVYTNDAQLNSVISKYTESGVLENLTSLKISDGCWVFVK